MLDKLPIGWMQLLLWLTAAAALTAGGFWWYHQPHIAEVEYQPCEISYGEILGEWSGDDEEAWNHESTRYVARSFSLKASSLEAMRPNTIEATPTRMATGGTHACTDDFVETIDTASEEYRWHGARANAVRFGVPELAMAEIAYSLGPHGDARGNSRLSVPVYEEPASRAAAWVDDGGSAVIDPGAETEELFWCINDTACEDITEQEIDGRTQRGEGYQFVADNCPAAIDCDGEWYGGTTSMGIEEDEHGQVAPFDLRLSAVSTYAPRVGNQMVLVFAYPETPEASLEASSSRRYFDGGDELEINLRIGAIGPAIEKIELEYEGESVALEEAGGSIEIDSVDELNEVGETMTTHSLVISPDAPGGTCHQIQYRLSVQAVEDLGVDSESAQATYCINQEPEPEPQSESTSTTTYTYSVNTRGETVADFDNFIAQAQETLRDSRGWSSANLTFERVESGGDFTLWLAAPNQMTSFSSMCSATYSCRVGRDVIINDERWRNATDTWNEAGGSIRDYRHMVINHEVGHLLGFGHYDCPAPGAPAPIMMQQSIDLQGCEFNPWPTATELEQL